MNLSEEAHAMETLIAGTPGILDKLEEMRGRHFEVSNDVARLLTETHEARMRVVRERRSRQAESRRLQDQLMRGADINHRRGETEIRRHLQFNVFTTEHWVQDEVAR